MKDVFLRTLGHRLKKLRASKGLKVEEVSSACGVSNTVIWNIEAGRSWPVVGTLEKLAEFYKCSPAFLFASDDEALAIAEVTPSYDASAAMADYMPDSQGLANLHGLQFLLAKTDSKVASVEELAAGMKSELAETQKEVTHAFGKLFPEVLELVKKVQDLEKRVEGLEASASPNGAAAPA